MFAKQTGREADARQHHGHQLVGSGRLRLCLQETPGAGATDPDRH